MQKLPMHLPKTLTSFFVRCSVFLVLASLFFGFATPVAHAQYDANTDPDVAQNQHTRAQVALIEGSAALICQLVGIDVVQPEKGCLGINPATQKIGYAPQGAGAPQIGGILGLSANLMGTLYVPPASGVSYLAQLRDNFGIVKKTYAQEVTGFDALSPVQKIWEVCRNITYALLVLIFILIGLGIMLRVKIDPRTAMSIQNQVPKIVIAIILITFSYSIIGFMVDVMWIGTYVGINALSSVSNGTICDDGSNKELSVREGAYSNLLNSPLAFMNDLLKYPEPPGVIFGNPSQCDLGIKFLSQTVASTAGNFITTLIQDLFKIQGTPCGFLDFGCNVENTLANFIGWIGQVIMLLVAFLAILIVMFRLWWQLLKAYALIIFYTILGPFWILMGLLPSSERNFVSWLRTVTAKLASFPAAAFMIVIARVILDSYGAPQNNHVTQSQYFIPPLVGNPNLGMLGPLLSFAILLIAPDILNMLNDALKAPASKYVGPAIQGGTAAGFAAGAPVGFIARRAFRKDSHGNAQGAGAQLVNTWAQHSMKTGAGPKGDPGTKMGRNFNRMKGAVGKGISLATGTNIKES